MKLPVLAIFAPTLLLVGLAACSRTSDEDQVRAVIVAAEQAAEARDTSDLVRLVADDYRDDRGNDKQELTQFLRGYLLMHPKVELLVNIGPVVFDTATRATVLVEVAMVGTQSSGGQNTSLTGDLEAFQVQLRKDDSQWFIVRADREERR
jgi:hypothetical protein